MSLVITAPTGNIGSSLVNQLLAADADLTLLVRNPDKLDASVRSRVKVEQGELQDAAFMQRATQGCEALFLLSPPNFTAPDVHAYYKSISDAATHAIQTNNIAHVVYISSGGGGDTNAGLVSETFRIEDALNATDANVLSLRCGSFMENFLMNMPTLREPGAFYGLYRPGLPVPYVATRDIAAVAARHLLNRTWQGKSFVAVQGAEDLTPDQAAQTLGEVIGKTIQYVQVPAEPMRQTFLQMGASPAIVDGYIEMLEAFDRGIYGAEPRTAETTTPTTLRQWAEEVLKPAFDAAA